MSIFLIRKQMRNMARVIDGLSNSSVKSYQSNYSQSNYLQTNYLHQSETNSWISLIIIFILFLVLIILTVPKRYNKRY